MSDFDDIGGNLLGVLDNLPLGALVLRRDFSVVFWNNILEEWTAIPREDILGKSITDFFPHLAEPRYFNRIFPLFDGGPSSIFSSQLHRYFIPAHFPDGRDRIQHTTVTALVLSGEAHALFSIQDVTDLTRLAKNARVLHKQALQEIDERKKAEEKLRLAASVFASTTEGIVVTDANGVILSVNPAFEQITGYSAAQAQGTTICTLRSEKYNQEFYDHVWSRIYQEGFWKGEIWDQRENGEEFALNITINAIHDENGYIRQYATIFSDITERKKMEEQLLDLSMRDGLTGIFNRRTFDRELEIEWRRSTRTKTPFSLIIIDIDYFKKYNDTYGHQKGDACIKAVAEIIAGSVHRPGDVTARYGGEEFVVLLPMTSSMDAISIAETMRRKVAALNITHEASKTGDVLTISAGVATVFPEKGKLPETVIRLADQALYTAKREGRNRVSYRDESEAVKKPE